jgi:hypothetical protein
MQVDPALALQLAMPTETPAAKRDAPRDRPEAPTGLASAPEKASGTGRWPSARWASLLLLPLTWQLGVSPNELLAIAEVAAIAFANLVDGSKAFDLIRGHSDSEAPSQLTPAVHAGRHRSPIRGALTV